MKNIVLLDVDKLKCHEKVIGKHVEKMIESMRKIKKMKRPIVVDKNSFVILDGHHRYTAFKRMGIKKIPCQIVDYIDKEVRVYLRRKKLLMKIIKDFVVRRANEGKLFPSKTTRHLIKNRIEVINYPLERLY